MADKCKNLAMYRYTWPGKEGKLICEDCSKWMQKVADVIGFHLHLIPLSEADKLLGLECTREKKTP